MANCKPSSLTINDVTVNQDSNGRYCLNDLHRAAGGEKRHQPSDFVRNASTVALIEEIHSGDSRSAPVKVINGGPNRGTYVCRELVYAYAAWVSPTFHLRVLRTFHEVVTGAYVVPVAAIRQAVAERFLGVGLAPYVTRFPTSFYEGIFRLRGWPWHGPGTPRPGVIAYYTNDLVYERLAPELLRLLRERNPMDKDTGRRAAKHHQLLSEDIGHPALAGHLHSVLCIMRSCATWDDFTMQMDRIHPRWGNNLLLPLPLAEDMRLLPEQF